MVKGSKEYKLIMEGAIAGQTFCKHKTSPSANNFNNICAKTDVNRP